LTLRTTVSGTSEETDFIIIWRFDEKSNWHINTFALYS